jgi:hypothetical protein
MAETQARPLNWRRYWQWALVALVGAPLANAIVYLIASSLGAIPQTVLAQPMNQPITIIPVIMASLMGALAGSILFAVLRRWLHAPVWSLYIMAAVALVLAEIPALQLQGAPPAMLVALNVMHLVAAGIVVWALLQGAKAS